MSAGSTPVNRDFPLVRSGAGLRIAWLPLVLLSALLSVQLSASEKDLSRFQRTAGALESASPELRSQFARAAITRLAEVYMAEADLARSDARAMENGPKLRAWSLAVDGFANQLLVLLQDLDLGSPAMIGLRREGDVAVTVNGRLTMLSHPRMDQQPAYEQAVLSDFCAAWDCRALTARDEPEKAIPLYAGAVRPAWSFSGRGPVCSHDGIRVQFGQGLELARLRDLCRQFLEEAVALLTELAWQRLHGASIEWAALATEPTPARPEHLVRLNAAGDSVLLTLPLLHASPQLLSALSPWLRARSAGDRAELHLAGAALMGSEPGSASPPH